MPLPASSESSDAVRCFRTVTIRRSPEELFAFWSHLPNLPKIMRHLESVEQIDAATSRWRAKAPAGQTVEWTAVVTEVIPGRKIAWNTTPGSQIRNTGSVEFRPAPADRGTEVKVELSYIPPAGKAGRWIASLFGEEPQAQLADDLIRFQALMETGEIPSTEGQTSGRRKEEAQ